MPTPVLPRDLYPVTSPSGYSYASAQGVHMTQVEGGFNRYAMDFDRGTRVYNVALACTAGHLLVWELFYLRIIKKGALAFEMPLDSGTGLEQHLVNIIPNSVNTTETDGNNFVVTFQVEAESKLILAPTYQIKQTRTNGRRNRLNPLNPHNLPNTIV